MTRIGPEETSDRLAMEAILARESLGHLAMTCDGDLYLVPLNYTYVDGTILFHCALQGRKLDMIRRNPSVCFEVSRQECEPAPHAGDLCDEPFESVICWGEARIVEDPRERQVVLNEFQTRYQTSKGPRQTISLERAEKCGAVEITIYRMTGRRRSGDDELSWKWEA